jgi:hypothetical protein
MADQFATPIILSASTQSPSFRYVTYLHSVLVLGPSLWLCTLLVKAVQPWNGLCFRLMFITYPFWLILLPILVLLHAVRSPRSRWSATYLILHLIVYLSPIVIFLADPARRAKLIF